MMPGIITGHSESAAYLFRTIGLNRYVWCLAELPGAVRRNWLLRPGAALHALIGQPRAAREKVSVLQDGQVIE